MFRTERIMLALSLAIICMATTPALADRDKREDRGRKIPVERFCPDGYSEIGHYEPFENRVRTVCATEVLVTPNSEIFRDVVRDTVVFPVCMAKDSLGEGAITTLTGFVSEALTVALQESAAVTEEVLNLMLAQLETNLNEALAGVELGTNESLAAITTGINSTLSSTENSLNAIDGQLNRVDDEIADGLFAARDVIADFIKSLDDPDFMPDFIDEGAVNGALWIPIDGIANLNIPDVSLGSLTAPVITVGGVVIDPAQLEAPEITLPDDPLKALLELTNLCSYPDEYTDLLLLAFGFEDAVDPVSGSAGIPEQVPSYNEALRMCSARGGHLCDQEEYEVLGLSPNPGEWAGGYGRDSHVVMMPGTRAYATPYPPLEANATNLFAFPRQVPVKIHPPVYPNGSFRCCTVTTLKVNKRGRFSLERLQDEDDD
jgi:hypothetical protein